MGKKEPYSIHGFLLRLDSQFLLPKKRKKRKPSNIPSQMEFLRNLAQN